MTRGVAIALVLAWMIVGAALLAALLASGVLLPLWGLVALLGAFQIVFGVVPLVLFEKKFRR